MKLRATVIKDIWPGILFFTLFSISEYILDHPPLLQSPIEPFPSRYRHPQTCEHTARGQQPAFDRIGCYSWFGYIFQDVDCIRAVS